MISEHLERKPCTQSQHGFTKSKFGHTNLIDASRSGAKGMAAWVQFPALLLI